jgi:2-keto-4-pentenoate hydratase/2-oxohepta-3-ene-1,7-dioic acid hydratase in catechol pathway
MKLTTFAYSQGLMQLGVVKDNSVFTFPYAPTRSKLKISNSVISVIKTVMKDKRNLEHIPNQLYKNDVIRKSDWVWKLSEVKIRTPLSNIVSLRDFYAFEQHVKTANQNRGREVPEEWYDFPVFYFTNPSAIFGPDDVIPYPSYTNELDYELEIACVIGKGGINIPADKAEDHIFGFTIFNDWSARDVQRKEMKVGLGPAKGKDFANSLGPYIVTPDELADKHTGRTGVYDLEMVARVNGVERSRGNMKDLYWSFGQMIERASQDVMLQPGEVIGSGTVGTGCLLETTKGAGPWLQPGDVVELEIERLGILKNIIGEKRNG